MLERDGSRAAEASSNVVTSISMSAPDITDAETAAVQDVLNSGHLSMGPKLDEFERSVARAVGSKHAIGVSSGTAGLHLCAIAAGLGPGDLVVTTPFSFVASANCFVYEHACPIFVDVDPMTYNLDLDQVREAVLDLNGSAVARSRWLPRLQPRDAVKSRSLSALLPVHTFGQPADMDRVAALAEEYELLVIEDACEAIGAQYKGREVGSIGDAGVFAFYPNKQLTTGEGGMIVTNKDDWAGQFRSLRNQGRDVFNTWLKHDRLGYNYRMSEMSAALGVVQCGRLDEILFKRDRVAQWYTERLSANPYVEVPHIARTTTRMSWFVYVVRLIPELDRRGIMEDLSSRGIPSRPYFTPIHLQPFYAERFGYRRGDFPAAEALGRSCLALPFSTRMSEEQVDRVCSELESVMSRRHHRQRQIATQTA